MKTCLLDKIFSHEQWDIFIDKVCRREFHMWDIPKLQIIDHLRQQIDVKNLIFQEKGRWGGVRVATQKEPHEDILQSIPTPPFIEALYAQGYTIIFNDMQDKLYSIYQLSHELHRLLYAGINCNCYITPPQTQSLKKHYDDEDVIVIQLVGEKMWKIEVPHENIFPDTYLSYIEEYAMLSGDESHDVLLKPGMALFLPKGTPHEVTTADKESIHLTFSISMPMVKDLLFKVVEMLSHDPCYGRYLRQNVLLNENEISLHEYIKIALSSVDDFFNNKKINNNFIISIIYDFIRRMDSSMIMDNSFIFHKISGNTKIQKNNIQSFILDNNNMILHYNNGSIELDEKSFFFTNRLLNGEIFNVSELPGDGIDEKILLAKNLLNQQIIVVYR